METPLTGERCNCRPGVWRDNCPQCEGTGRRIDFRAIHAAREKRELAAKIAAGLNTQGKREAQS